MILAHIVVGVFPTHNNEFSVAWFLGSIAPDIDHLFLLVKNRIYSWKKIVRYMRYSDSHKIKFKTKYLHSVFGALLMSLPFLYINFLAAKTFFYGYLLHLILDWPDHDEKQFLFPMKKKFKGFLPIFSKPEIAFTMALVVLYFYKYF